MEEALVGFGCGDGSDVVEEDVPESGVEEVEDGVFGASDVEVGAAPVLFFFYIYRGVGVFGVEVAEVIPAGACPLGHGVGFSCGFDPVVAFGACFILGKGFAGAEVEVDVEPFGLGGEGAFAVSGGLIIFDFR